MPMRTLRGRRAVSDFARALPIIRRSECHPACRQGEHAKCFTNNPDDPGGATCCGIIQRTYDAYRISRHLPGRPVQEHGWDEHADLYKERFWDRGRCGDLAWPLSLIHFDACVNHGTEPRAPNGAFKVNGGRLLQLAAHVVPVDGIVGPQTLAHVRAAPLAVTCYRYICERFFRYDDLADANPRLIPFQVGGWEQRLKDLYTEVA